MSGETNNPTDRGDGIVEGDSTDNRIDLAYTGDPEGDRIDNEDALLPGEGPQDDIVDAGAGDDTILAEQGDDDVYAGSGDDSVTGGAGDDLIYGDSNLPGGIHDGGDGGTVRESFEWDLAPNDRGFVQNTGSVDVTFRIVQEHERDEVESGVTTEEQNVSGIETDGDPADSTSSFESTLNGEGNEGDYNLEFSEAVENVSFRINDVDGDGRVAVKAFDADGRPVEVFLSGGADVTLDDTISPDGEETATSNGGGDQPATSDDNSVLVDIPGPISRISILHDQDGPAATDMNITDVYFDAPGEGGGDTGVPGNDTLLGDDGNDTLFGEAGDDMLAGGAGADSLVGGDDRDVMVGGDAGDFVDGGTGGDDYDTLDLRGEGPLQVVDETEDADGDSTSGTVEFLDTDGRITGSMEFREIENLLVPETGNADPVANDDQVTTDEDVPVENISVLDNDSDPDNDPLTVTDATADNGSVTINGDGTLNYTPDENFNGTDTISYSINDGNGGTAGATVTVTVNPVNDAPVAADDDNAITDFETDVVVPVLDNDSDVDGDTLTVTGTSDPANGMTTINGDGTVTYTPDDGFSGTDSFSYTVDDGNGGTDTATVTVTVREDEAGGPDGIVEGDDGDNRIDETYTGDPEGDMIDNEDAILPGEAPNDDIVEAGDGDDTIFGRDGDDEINGDDGADVIYGGSGDDEIRSDGDNVGVPDHETFVGVPFETGAAQLDNTDTVYGGDGDDTISTGDDADAVTGDAGNDVIDGGLDDDAINGGIGADSIIGGLGNDQLVGSAGDDTIIGGIDAFSDYEGDDPNLPNELLIDPATGLPALSDPNPADDRDTVFGGIGDDLIMTGDDADVVRGNEGNDTINAGIDDDDIRGGFGDDSLTGSHGSDTILGGEGNDTIWGGFGNDPIAGTAGETPDATDPVPENGLDVINGAGGDDLIYGEDDDDTLLGGEGNDTVFGGIDDDSIRGQDGDDSLMGDAGDDTVQGGAGNDTIFGGAGNDDLQGRADRDLFTDATAGDTVDGGTGDSTDDGVNDDFDTLDLTGSGPLRVVDETVDADGDSTSGTVEFLDGDRNVTGTLEFREIENLIPCFTPGTVIATPRGECRVEDLQVGDRVITRDNGLQEIRWIGKRALSGPELIRAPHLQPVLIRAGSLGRGLPERDMMVSPQHRVLMHTDRSALYFDEHEVLAAAKHLTGLDGVDTVEASGTTYIHFMFDQHEVVLSNGAWTESFQPGEQVLDGLGDAQRDELYELFPDLREAKGIAAYQAARRSLKKHEARLLTR